MSQCCENVAKFYMSECPDFIQFEGQTWATQQCISVQVEQLLTADFNHATNNEPLVVTRGKLEVRISNNKCVSTAKQCVWCDANWHAPGDKSECVQCPPDKPYRLKTSKDQCRACFYFESWDTLYCNIMRNISIRTDMVIESYHDEFKLEIHSDALIVPRAL